MSANELYHHGIDGQRWGVKHGPPYPLDRADHNKVVEKSKKATEKRHLSYTSSRKYAKRMTDKDLNDTIDRLQREETYRRLVSGEKTSNKLAKKQLKATKEANKLRKEEQKLNRERFEEDKKNNSIGKKAFEKAILVTTEKIINKLVGDWVNKLPENKPKDENKSKNQNDNINIKKDENLKKQEEVKEKIKNEETLLKNLPKEEKRITVNVDEPIKETKLKSFSQYLKRDNDRKSVREDWPKDLDDDYWESEANKMIADDVIKKMQLHSEYSEGYINNYLLKWGDGL